MDYPITEIETNPDPYYETAIRVDLYAGSFTSFADVIAIPTINKGLCGVLYLSGYHGHGLVLEWRDPVGGLIWKQEFVGKGMKEIAGC